MNKSAIKTFALWARKTLTAQIMEGADQIGITPQGVADPLPQSTYQMRYYRDSSGAVTGLWGEKLLQRERIVRMVEEFGFEGMVKQVAYTWFNRLIGVRYLEVNGFLPQGCNILSPGPEGGEEPQMVTHMRKNIGPWPWAQRERWQRMYDDGEKDRMFHQMFLYECSQLGKCIPGFFDHSGDGGELLVRLSYTQPDGLVQTLLRSIPEEDFGDEVEVIGWMYQYYNAEEKDKIFAQLKKNIKIAKEDVPSVTQLFTPHWLVRYMVENSLGRLWLTAHPEENLEKNWRYYVKEAPQEERVLPFLQKAQAPYAGVQPQDLRIIDPCMGSGHILVYAMDVLMQIYRSQGWQDDAAVRMILERNLYGLDVDDRAYQLTCFAVMMRAIRYDPDILKKNPSLHIYSVQESNHICKEHIDLLGANITDTMSWQKVHDDLCHLVELFRDAKEYGSALVMPEDMDFDEMERFAAHASCDAQMTFDTQGYDITQQQLGQLLSFARMLSRQYDVVVTNPPYMSQKGMSEPLARYTKIFYPDSKHDLFAVFLERCGEMTKNSGYQAMVTQHAFMFLSSYEPLRQKLLRRDMVNMVHLGARAFEDIGGEIVQTTAFVMRNSDIKRYQGTYCRLVDAPGPVEKEEMFLSGQQRFQASKENFIKLPGCPYAYWAGPKVMKLFEQGVTVGQCGDAKQGMATTDTQRFLRRWYELSQGSLTFGCADRKEALASGGKWFPINKGGDYRKWYGNNLMAVNFEKDGREIKENVLKRYPYLKTPDFVVKNQEYYFRSGITWTLITSSHFGVRCFPQGMLFDVSAHCVFADGAMKDYLAAYLNSNVAREILDMLNPTLNFPSGVIAKLPLRVEADQLEEISRLVQENVALAKEEWDSFEQSWDFVRHPLLPPKGKQSSLAECYQRWEQERKAAFTTLWQNEEKLNQMFVKICQVEGEISPQVAQEDITLRLAQPEREAKSLLSYLVGVVLGRYSLEKDGAQGGGSQLVDLEELPKRVMELLTEIYGSSRREETLDTLAQMLGTDQKGEEAIVQYFAKEFYKDHLRAYQNLPIYWVLELGESRALCSFHGMTKETLDEARELVQGQLEKERTEYQALEKPKKKDIQRMEKLERQSQGICQALQKVEKALPFEDAGIGPCYDAFRGIQVDMPWGTQKVDLVKKR